MNYEKVVIKQVPDELAVLTGLNKYNRSKMPKTGDFLCAAIHNGRAITGIDEDGYEINSISDSVKREEIRTEKKALREFLQSKIQKDLSATSNFWEDFGVSISSDSPLVLNKSNPLDVIRYHMLIANGYAAPNKESTGDPKYRNAKYYCFVEERENDEEVSTQMLRDKSRAELLKLSENEELMVLVGQYLEGDKYKPGMKVKTLYKMLSDYISVDADNLKRFVRAISLGPEDLQFKVTIDRAIKKKVIIFNNKQGYYQKGQTILGKNPLQVYENLKKPEFAGEFLLIKDELEA